MKNGLKGAARCHRDGRAAPFSRRNWPEGRKMNIHLMLEELDSLYGRGELAEAEKKMNEWLQEALEENNLGAALTLYNEMEGVYRTTGRAVRAVECADRALELIGQMGLSGTIHHGTTLLNGATASRMAQDKSKALALYQQAEDIFTALGENRSYQMASLYNNISQLYQEEEKHEDALAYLNRAMEIVKEMENSEPEVATTHVNRALSLMALNRMDEAKREISEAMVYYDSPEGRCDGHRGAALAAAGELAWRDGQGAEAVSFFERAIDITRERFGENDACRVMRKNLEMIQKSLTK